MANHHNHNSPRWKEAMLKRAVHGPSSQFEVEALDSIFRSMCADVRVGCMCKVDFYNLYVINGTRQLLISCDDCTPGYARVFAQIQYSDEAAAKRRNRAKEHEKAKADRRQKYENMKKKLAHVSDNVNDAADEQNIQRPEGLRQPQRPQGTSEDTAPHQGTVSAPGTDSGPDAGTGIGERAEIVPPSADATDSAGGNATAADESADDGEPDGDD